MKNIGATSACAVDFFSLLNSGSFKLSSMPVIVYLIQFSQAQYTSRKFPKPTQPMLIDLEDTA